MKVHSETAADEFNLGSALVARILGVTERRVQQLKLPSIRVGVRRLYRYSDVLAERERRN